MIKQDKEPMTLKDILLNTRKYVLFLFSKWIIIILISIVGAIIGLLNAYTSKPKYRADLSFVLSSTSKSGGLSGLASQFGIDIGNNGGDVLSGDNIMTLMCSRRMIQAALFKKLPEQNETLLNMLVTELEFWKSWNGRERTRAAYPFPEDAGKLSPVQDSLVKEICALVGKKVVYLTKPDIKQNIYNVEVISTNEIFSTYLTKYLVDVTFSFYEQTKTKVTHQNLELLQKEADSLRNLLGTSIVETNTEIDKIFNLNPSQQVKRSNTQQKQANATVVSAAYGEVVKNLEIAKITLQRETPVFQVIDEPTLPLKREKPGKLVSMILGGLIGFLLIVVVLTVKQLVKKIISN